MSDVSLVIDKRARYALIYHSCGLAVSVSKFAILLVVRFSSTAVARFSVCGTVSRYSIYDSFGLLERFGIPVCRLHSDGEIDRFRQTEVGLCQKLFLYTFAA